MDSNHTLANHFDSKERPPKVKGLPLIGNLIDLVRNPIEFLKSSHATYGDAFQVSAGTKKYVVLAGIEANRFVSSEGRDYFSSKETWGKFVEKMDCPHLLIGSDGESHSYQRKLLKPFFAKNAFKDRLHLLTEIAESHFESIDAQIVDIGPFIRNLFCQQIGLVLQGERVNTQQSEEFMLSQNTYMNIYMVGKWPRLMLLNPKFLLADRKTNLFSKQLIQKNARREKSNTTFVTYMDKVAEGQKAHPEWFTEGDVHAHTMLPFVGGIDPAGGTQSYILFELLKHPELRARVTREIDKAYENGFPSYEDMERMEDTKGFIYETMRLHPTGYALSRTASSDFIFSGYHIEQGDELLIFNTANHFKDEFFPNASAFDIERYREPRNEHKTRHAFAPFGRGPHTCVANGLAELQLMVNTIIMLRYFELDIATPLEKLTTDFTPVPFMSSNFKVRFTRRHLK